jgi:hypothetical protein
LISQLNLKTYVRAQVVAVARIRFNDDEESRPPDPAMLSDAGALDPTDEICREYERVVDARYLDQIRTEAKQFSNKLFARQSGVARCAIMNFKKGKNTIKPRPLRKLTKAIHNLQNKGMKSLR